MRVTGGRAVNCAARIDTTDVPSTLISRLTGMNTAFCMSIARRSGNANSRILYSIGPVLSTVMRPAWPSDWKPTAVTFTAPAGVSGEAFGPFPAACHGAAPLGRTWGVTRYLVGAEV